MGALLMEVQNGWLSPEAFALTFVRLAAAMAVGAIAGINRELGGKAAGLRTHMLVSMGAAMFVMTAVRSGLAGDDVTPVIQGVAAGIGFLGGGAILKSGEEKEIRGLTTAGSIWMTAAAGVAAGLGHLLLALLASVMVWVVLAVIARVERWLGTDESNRA
jgi:putative Mg2+ transporter-C (MgtC) family protein